MDTTSHTPHAPTRGAGGYILYVYMYLRPYRGSPAPPPLSLVLYACSGLLSMHISVVAVMAAFGVKLGPRWSQVRALLEPSWAKLGLLEGVWGPCWAQKSVLGGLLGGSWGHLGPKSQSRPPRVRRWASKGLPGTPKLEAKLDPKRSKLGPNGAQVGDFVDLCPHLCVHGASKEPSEPNPRPT